jgi:hypothetical protein
MDLPATQAELQAMIRTAVAEALEQYRPTLNLLVHDAVRTALEEHLEIVVEDSLELLDGEP